VEDAFNRLFVNSVLEEKQKVDIRLRMNSAAAVSADGEQAKRAGRLPLRPKLLKDVVDFVANDAFDWNGCRILQESDLQLVQEPLQVCPGRHGAHGPMLAHSRPPEEGRRDRLEAGAPRGGVKREIARSASAIAHSLKRRAKPQ